MIVEPIPIDEDSLKEFLELHGITGDVKEVIVEFCPPELDDPDVLRKLPKLARLKDVRVRFKPHKNLFSPAKPLSKSETPTARLLEELFVHYPNFVVIAGSACDLPIMLFENVNEKLEQGADPKAVIVDWFFDFVYTEPRDVITKLSVLSNRKDVRIITKIVSKSFDKCDAKNVFCIINNDVSWMDREQGTIHIKMMAKSKSYAEIVRQISQLLKDRKVILYLGTGLRYFERTFHTLLPPKSLVVYCDITDERDILKDLGRVETLNVIKVLDKLEDIFYTFDLSNVI